MRPCKLNQHVPGSFGIPDSISCIAKGQSGSGIALFQNSIETRATGLLNSVADVWVFMRKSFHMQVAKESKSQFSYILATSNWQYSPTLVDFLFTFANNIGRKWNLILEINAPKQNGKSPVKLPCINPRSVKTGMNHGIHSSHILILGSTWCPSLYRACLLYRAYLYPPFHAKAAV